MADYTKLNPTGLQTILDFYGLNLCESTQISEGMANSSYLINSQYILSILDNHTSESAERLVAIVNELASNGFPVVSFENNSNGELVTKTMAGLATLRRHVNGQTMSANSYATSHNLLTQMAHLHRYCPRTPLNRFGRRLPADSMNTLNDNAAPNDIVLAVQEMVDLEETGFFDSRPICLVHGDLSGSNVIIRDDSSLIIIDWETCCLDDPLLDLGVFIVHAIMSRALLTKQDLHDCIESYYLNHTGRKETETTVLKAAKYSAVFLAFHRFNRHCVRYPNTEKSLIFREMLDIKNLLEVWHRESL